MDDVVSVLVRWCIVGVGFVVLGFVCLDGIVCWVLYFDWMDVVLVLFVECVVGYFVWVGNDVSFGGWVEYFFGVG